MKKFRNTPEAWSLRLTEVLDLLAYCALATTGEVRNGTWLPLLVLLPLRWFTAFRLRAFFVTLFLIGLLAAAVAMILLREFDPVTALVNVVPYFIFTIGLSTAAKKMMGWRIGLGFIAITLSAAVNADFLLPILVVAYVLVSSVAISCEFLSLEFANHIEKFAYLRAMELPKRFLIGSFTQAFVVLLTAGLIFPLLPRMPHGGGGGFGGGDKSTRTGYTEEVNLKDWGRYRGDGDSQVVLRIYNRTGRPFEELLPQGLLRTRTLGMLSPESWLPVTKFTNAETPPDPRRHRALHRLHFIREALPTSHLPIPYNTEDLATYYQGALYSSYPTRTGEWVDRLQRREKIEYLALVSTEGEKFPRDEPSAFLTQVPAIYRTKEILALRDQLFRGKRTAQEKIDAVQAYFAMNTYEPSLPGAEENRVIAEGVHPIQHFLFTSKKGHCELFSTASAVLLRLGNVPARLITGFRVSRFSREEVTSVRMGDAHAWIEAYDGKRGWIPLDTTPRILLEPSVAEWFRDQYDFLSAKWYEYVLSYGERTPTLTDFLATEALDLKNMMRKKWARGFDASWIEWAIFLVVMTLVSFAFSFIALRFYRVTRREKLYADADPRLTREWRRMEDFLEKRSELRADPEIQAWIALYAKARFGRPNAARVQAEVTELKRWRGQLVRSRAENSA